MGSERTVDAGSADVDMVSVLYRPEFVEMAGTETVGQQRARCALQRAAVD
jgi:hypothetical protein